MIIDIGKNRSWKKEEALREGKTINGARYFPNLIHAPIPTDMISDIYESIFSLKTSGSTFN
ncbi:MAG: hypothetical protein F6K48_00950 [Okeania sp. SIO3H1]|uniref:hypothetical protein n=1 Tax=Okeania sp. SIO1I7 TaxID=2607772 RepID=UPI0013C8BE37|nr:hypothetical protein [Okeania sp. SIO1I7]NEN87571.1 hypothetical protein [Okeania sp. SIO3H1]NET24506.1 hypothetical protein [Okeania sp. SIO1I7]